MKYFLNLEKFKAGAKGMNTMLKPDRMTTSNQNEILKEQYKFYKNLYTNCEGVVFDFTSDTI